MMQARVSHLHLHLYYSILLYSMLSFVLCPFYLQSDAGKMYKMLKTCTREQQCGPNLMRCGLCGGTTSSFKMLAIESQNDKGRSDFDAADLRRKVQKFYFKRISLVLCACRYMVKTEIEGKKTFSFE